MKYLTREVKIGLTGVVALVVLFVGLNFLKGINLFKSTATYHVLFQDAKGLAKSSPVYADGYDIGIVRNITYDYERPGHVVVEIEVDDQLRIPVGSTAELNTAMLGGCDLHLLLANNPRERLAPGDTLRGAEAMGLMSKAGAMVPQVEAVLGKVDSLLTSLNKLTADPNLPLIMQHTAALTQSLNRTTDGLNRLLEKDVPQLTGTLNQAGENVVTLTDNLNQLDLQATLAHVDSTLAELEQITAKLNSPDNNLGLLLNDKGLYNNLNRTVGSADSLLRDMKARPGRYIHFSVFGKKSK